MKFSTEAQEERYIKAHEKIADMFEQFVGVFNTANEIEPPVMPEVPLSQKLQEIEIMAQSIDRLKHLRSTNDDLKVVIDNALSAGRIDLEHPTAKI